MVIKVDINQAPPVVGVSDANVNRPFIGLAPAVRSAQPVAEHRQGRLQRPARQVPAAVRQQLLVPELVRSASRWTTRRTTRRASPTPTISSTTGDRRTTTCATPSLRAGSTSCRGRGAITTAAGSWAASCWRGGLPLTVTQTQGVADRHRQPTEPDLRRQARQPDDRSLVRHVVLRSHHRADRHVWRHPARVDPRARVVQHRRVADQEHAVRPGRDRVPHRGVQPAESPAVRQPEHDDRQRLGRRHLGDAVEPVLLALRHDRAAGAAGGEGEVLIGDRGPLQEILLNSWPSCYFTDANEHISSATTSESLATAGRRPRTSGRSTRRLAGS